MPSWDVVPIGDVVSQFHPPPATPAPDDNVRFVGVRWYGAGLFVREVRAGSEIKGKCYPLKPGMLIYNRLFAWKRSFAVVDDALDGAVVSNEFPQFAVDGARAVPKFLALYCASPPFAARVLGRSEGSAAVSRNRLKEAEFLKLPVALPPLRAQASIVEVMAAVDDAITALDSEAAALAKVVLARREALTNNAGYRQVSARIAFDIRLGRQRSPARATGPGMTKYLRSANIGHDELRLDDVLEMDFDDRERARYALQDGDVLVSEGSAGAAAVGMPAAWHCEIEGPICFQNTLLRYRARDGVTSPEFVRHWCLWAYESGAFRTTAPPGVNILHIGARRAEAMTVGLPTLDEQQAIVEELGPLTDAVRSLRAEADELRTARSALLDALLTGKIEVAV